MSGEDLKNIEYAISDLDDRLRELNTNIKEINNSLLSIVKILEVPLQVYTKEGL